jgi:hypothetical protein
VRTALGDYRFGGENGDAFPRMAVPADGKADRLVYLAPSPGSPGRLALVVLDRRSSAVVTRFYAGMPTDALLAADIPAALAGQQAIMSYDAARKTVRYDFMPAAPLPPPVMSGPQPDGSDVAAGPQILIANTADPSPLDLADGLRHRPSGFACPEVIPELPVTLKSIEPSRNSLVCSYRAGTDLAYREEDPIRYQLTLVRGRRGETARKLFDRLTASARAGMRIKDDHPAPLAAGRNSLPEFVAYWDTEDDGVQGVWVGKAGGWIVWLRAQYPPAAASDVEAGKVARLLFTAVAKQVK